MKLETRLLLPISLLTVSIVVLLTASIYTINADAVSSLAAGNAKATLAALHTEVELWLTDVQNTVINLSKNPALVASTTRSADQPAADTLVPALLRDYLQ